MAKKAKKKAKKKAAKKAAKKASRGSSTKAVKKAGKKAKKTGKKKGRRTVLYSSKGKKLYAVRDGGGKFKDIQSYQRSHAADLRRKSKAEAASDAAPATADQPMF
ncbi:MAG: hypothetical protein HRU70_09100 [Phycisphaeraceae bacterium]|nr:MAG: hypothetical protein HRU70_09100 [Phycisphaeraceae bacterium]